MAEATRYTCHVRTTPYHAIKPVLDLLVALVMLVVLGPLMLLVAIIVRLDSRGPAIYCQERVGASGKHFTMLKFRTMKVGTPVLSTADMQKQPEIPYTRLGPFLRKTNLDELPQLLNVLVGQMSFVGPRPALPSQTDVVTLRVERAADRARPGITGLAQVMGRDDLDVQTKVSYDAEYCAGMSFFLDLKILSMTIGAVLSARGNK